MKPVTQTKFGGEEGNCLQACLASILEIDIEEIPWFGADAFWVDRKNEWLAQFDLAAIDIDVSSSYKGNWKYLGYHLINGPSPRGDFWHAVVGKNGRMVHDPHPSGDGLKEERTFTLFIKQFDERRK